ncbi:pectin lyase-like protein [Piromyces finnis]|uniref:Pectin lyase-like protein n=1 Tax=Piromyces finnis TaxID=1754191 RepID=A0A1Y1UYQ0_9FUNG|nr:pectin lyase-like protein [Piromyces finnis]|eukprot:ORX43649.1 pectin lyase-like protein [Piromyces finnis]
MKCTILLAALSFISSSIVYGKNNAYYQCGGVNWKGPEDCPTGYNCKKYNDLFSQCVPEEPNNFQIKSKLEGFAEGTTGGYNGKVITVTNQSELEGAVSGKEPKIINVNGIIKLTKDITLHSNTSLIGVGNNSGLTGAGIYFKSESNIIIQNLKFSYCLGSSKDCIGARRSSNIWIDHCEFYSDLSHDKDYYDGLIDFSYACENITISWNYIHDHSKVSLIGHSDNNESTDFGKFHITYHHNYFKNCISRLPSLRFANAHIYNNVYENIEYIAINSRMKSQVLIENNIFSNVAIPIATNRESIEEGFVNERNNDFGNSQNNNSITKIGSFTSLPYKYELTNVSEVYKQVTQNVGPIN